MTQIYAGGRTKKQWKALHAELPMDERLRMLNEHLSVERARWVKEELPRVREEYFASGFVPREAITDCIVSVDELLNDPHEIWRWDWWNPGNWYRVEIEA